MSPLSKAESMASSILVICSGLWGMDTSTIGCRSHRTSFPKTTSFVLRDLVVRFQRLPSLCQVDEVIDARFQQVLQFCRGIIVGSGAHRGTHLPQGGPALPSSCSVLVGRTY